MKKKPKNKIVKTKKPVVRSKRRTVNKIQRLGVEAVVDMLKALMAGKDVKAVTFNEKRVKASLIKDIAYAKKKGYQIEIPYI